MSPKFINGSFAALFDNVDIVAEYARHISRSRTDDLNGTTIYSVLLCKLASI